jgi:hypothetical protein
MMFFRKPVPTFRHHALGRRLRGLRRLRRRLRGGPRLRPRLATAVHDAHFLRAALANKRTNLAVADTDPVQQLVPEAAPLANLNDCIVRPLERGQRHGLRRRCQGEGKGNSDQSAHLFSSRKRHQKVLTIRGSLSPIRPRCVTHSRNATGKTRLGSAHKVFQPNRAIVRRSSASHEFGDDGAAALLLPGSQPRWFMNAPALRRSAAALPPVAAT